MNRCKVLSVCLHGKFNTLVSMGTSCVLQRTVSMATPSPFPPSPIILGAPPPFLPPNIITVLLKWSDGGYAGAWNVLTDFYFILLHSILFYSVEVKHNQHAIVLQLSCTILLRARSAFCQLCCLTPSKPSLAPQGKPKTPQVQLQALDWNQKTWKHFKDHIACFSIITTPSVVSANQPVQQNLLKTRFSKCDWKQLLRSLTKWKMKYLNLIQSHCISYSAAAVLYCRHYRTC